MSITATHFATGFHNISTTNLAQNSSYLNNSNDYFNYSTSSALNQLSNNLTITKFVNTLPKIQIKSNADYLKRSSHDSKASIPSKYHLLFADTSIQNSQITNSSASQRETTTRTLTSTRTLTPTRTLDTDSTEKSTENSIAISFFIIFLILWNIYGFFIQIKILFFTESKESTNQFLDNCTLKSSYFKYMVRLKYSDLIGGYQLSSTTVMVDLFDTRDRFITRFTIPPSWFASNDRAKGKINKVAKFRLNRKFELPEIGSIKITHDLFIPDGSAICIQNLQIKDLNNNKLINVPINRSIKALGPDAKFLEQMFEANKPISIEPDEDMFNDEITPDVTIIELFMFIFIYVNLSFVLTMVCKYLASSMQNKSLSLLISCLVPNALSLFLLLCIIKLYQHFVKELFIFKTGSDEWRLARIIFLILNLAFSITANIVSVWIITLVKADIDTLFLVCTPIFSLLSILLLFTIYSYSKFQINKKIKLKQGSLTILSTNLVTREKQSLQIPLECFTLKSSKEQIAVKF